MRRDTYNDTVREAEAWGMSPQSIDTALDVVRVCAEALDRANASDDEANLVIRLLTDLVRSTSDTGH
jgi:hypothetical protein